MDKQISLNRTIGITMFKDKKTTGLYVGLLGAIIIIIVLVVYIMGMNSTNKASQTSTAQTTSVSSKSSTKTYTEGKDYTVTYSNDGIISKDKVDEAVKWLGLDDQKMIKEFFFQNKDGDVWSEAKFYYNADKNVMEIESFKNGKPTGNVLGYDYATSRESDSLLGDENHLANLPMVYDFKVK